MLACTYTSFHKSNCRELTQLHRPVYRSFRDPIRMETCPQSRAWTMSLQVLSVVLLWCESVGAASEMVPTLKPGGKSYSQDPFE